MLQALDDAAVGQWYRTAVAALSEARTRLDDLNVFPVPDGDTGTNLLLTAQAAVAALDHDAARTTESDRDPDPGAAWGQDDVLRRERLDCWTVLLRVRLRPARQ